MEETTRIPKGFKHLFTSIENWSIKKPKEYLREVQPLLSTSKCARQSSVTLNVPDSIPAIANFEQFELPVGFELTLFWQQIDADVWED